MKYTFQATDDHATHVRTSDGVTGILHEHSDASVVLPLSTLVDMSDFAAIPEPPEPVVVPQEIANWRAKAVLSLAGILPSVEKALNALEDPAKTVALSAWNGGAEVHRNGLTVAAAIAALDLTDAQVDAMFIQAAALQV